MISSNFISQIIERYFASKNIGSGNELVIYENPDRSERQDIAILAKMTQKGGSGPYVRIIADAKSKKVYVWDAFYAEHTVGRSVIGLPSTNPVQTPWLLYGTCLVKGSNFELHEWDSKPSYKDFKFFDDFFSYDWMWLKPYVDTKEYFDDMHRWLYSYRGNK